MKSPLYVMLVLLLLLPACVPREPEAAPTPPVASPTRLLSPVDPTATKESSLSPDPSESETAVIVLHQEGGLAGVENEWSIHADGRVLTNSGAELQVESEKVTELLETIEQAGFFDLERPEPANVCCDFFTFTLTVRNGESENVVVISEGDPSIPEGLSTALAAVQELILSASE
jgi:hypothetical protein